MHTYIMKLPKIGVIYAYIDNEILKMLVLYMHTYMTKFKKFSLIYAFIYNEI